MVVVGGGFAGSNCARGLRDQPVRVTLIDRRNHHVFQPLLYQVATASLSPADISSPIRGILRRQKNAEVWMGEVVGVDVDARCLALEDGARLHYDYLVVAGGATHAYFGHEEWAKVAPGLKTVDDATEMRRRFLLAFEAAEREADPEARRQLLTFVIIGAGPTGVELAGAMAEIARQVMPNDFRTIDTKTTRILLLEGMDRVLPGGYPPPPPRSIGAGPAPAGAARRRSPNLRKGHRRSGALRRSGWGAHRRRERVLGRRGLRLPTGL